MAVKKSVVVLCLGFFCRLRQCMNRLLLKRRNMPMTRMDLGRRTRHWSSRWLTSNRRCKPFSIPHAARLSASHCSALSWCGGKLVSSATVSGLCWRKCRRNKATCSTQGKSTSSGLAARERNTRTSNCPLLNSLRPAKFSAVCRGGKRRRWRRNQFFDVSSYGRLVVFDRQQKISAVFEHQLAGGLVLSMEGVQTDFASVEVELLEECACDGDFVGFGVHHGAAQIILAGHTHRSQHALTAAMLGLFSVQHNKFVSRGGPSDLFLDLENDFLQSLVINVFHHATEGRLAGSRIALRLLAHAQGAALGLAHAFGELG